LLSAWIYSFGVKVPKALGKGDEAQILTELKDVLAAGRFEVKNPYDLLQQYEMVGYTY